MEAYLLLGVAFCLGADLAAPAGRSLVAGDNVEVLADLVCLFGIVHLDLMVSLDQVRQFPTEQVCVFAGSELIIHGVQQEVISLAALV